MFRWAPYTFVRILLFLIGGILPGIFYPDALPTDLSWVILSSLTAAYAILFILSHNGSFNHFNPGVVGLGAIFLTGYLMTVSHSETRRGDHLIHVKDTIHYFKAVVTGYPEEKQNSWKCYASVSGVYTNRWKDTHAKVVLYFSKSDFKIPFRYGDVLLIKGNPVLVPGPANPHEFDYRQYLNFKNVYHQHFIRESGVRFLKKEAPSKLVEASMNARRWADEKLKESVSGKREQGIASALVLGITDGIDNELLSAYSATGAMHVLAVSGLHISIIYLLILWLCKPILKYKSGPWILAIISLFLLWAYAFITGLSPSVLRAVTMFSFIAIAKPAKQITNIYNILAVSAFCLLVFDPFLIMSVGFQLSYVAVIGILYIQPGLYDLWNPKNYLADQTWKVTTVAIAAQLATLPLGLLYFHQFPNYFLITNMLVVPISFVVLVAGIAAILLNFIPVLISLIGWVLTWSIKLMNGVIFITESLPFAITENIMINVFQCWMLIIIIICASLLLKQKRFSWMIATFICVVLYAGGGWYQYYNHIRPSKIIVYDIDGHSAFDLKKDGQTYFFANSALRDSSEGKIRFHIQPGRIASGIRKIKLPDESITKVCPWGTVSLWEKKLIVNLTEDASQLPGNLQTDYLIISFQSLKSLASISFGPKPPKIILDSSNSYFYVKQIMEEAKAMKLDVYSVGRDGAYHEVINSI